MGAYKIRAHMELDKARLTYCAGLCMNDYPEFHSAEKSRIFNEFKVYLNLRTSFRNDFLPEKFKEF